MGQKDSLAKQWISNANVAYAFSLIADDLTDDSVTVSVEQVPNFHQLPVVAATNVLYNLVIPACEQKEVKLSACGNAQAIDSLESFAKYE